MKPLQNYLSVTKKQLIEYLQSRTDIPDEAFLSLCFDDKKFRLMLNWSYSVGAFADEIVEFSELESADVITDVNMSVQ